MNSTNNQIPTAMHKLPNVVEGPLLHGSLFEERGRGGVEGGVGGVEHGTCGLDGGGGRERWVVVEEDRDEGFELALGEFFFHGYEVVDEPNHLRSLINHSLHILIPKDFRG